MSIETLVAGGRDRVHEGLASVGSDRLRKMRSESLRSCFVRFGETDFRLEFVARIHGKEFVNDAAARSVNATWYALQNTEGGIIWIAFGGDDSADYSRLRPLVLRKVRMLLCVGSDCSRLHEAFAGTVPVIEDFPSIGAAVSRACYAPCEKAKVLFSPATREGLDDETAGRIFRREVNEL